MSKFWVSRGGVAERLSHRGVTTTPPYVVIWSFGHGFQKWLNHACLRGAIFDHVFLRFLVLVKILGEKVAKKSKKCYT